MSTPIFGAGLWNFASYVDRYATDGYAEPVSTLEQIRIAGSVGDLSYVDLNFPYSHDATLDEIKEALAAADLKAIGITPTSTCGASAAAPSRTPTRRSASRPST